MKSLDDTTFRAYETHPPQDMEIEPAPVQREWMDQCHERFPYRCLPLVLANQAGWTIPCPTRFTVRWNGGPRKQDLRLWFPKGCRETRIQSHFGYGVLTISLPYLFRTPSGINLWVKGPSNWIKDAIQPLEGIVESDWSSATFTMNWKVTREHHAIRFEKGEPICMVVPWPRGLVEQLRPRREPLAHNKKLAAEFQAWSDNRRAFNRALGAFDEQAAKQGWQKDYFLGRQADGRRFPQHQTHLDVKEFSTE
jgi:hypothetical protein